MKVIVQSQIINADDRIINYTPVLLEDVKYPLTQGEIDKLKVNVELYLDTRDINYVGNLYLFLDNKLVRKVKIYRYY